MPRTPVLRFLHAIARDHHIAEKLGISPAELRERRAEAAITRRRFLQGSAALAAAATVLPRGTHAAGAPRVVIVGAGIAGLNAALTLQDKGIAATIYEAANYVGGRMKSETSGYWANGQVSEIYGELIDTNHTVMQALAQRFNLPVSDLNASDPAGSTETYHFNGQWVTAAQIDADFEPVRAAAKKDLTDAGYPTLWNKYKPAGYALDHMSVYEWIQSRVPGGTGSALGKLLDVAYNEEYGAETTDQASLNLLYLLAYQPGPKDFAVFGVSDERYHIDGGNQKLPLAIAAALPPDSIRLGHRMTRVTANADGTVTLEFDTGTATRTVTADQVILTTPFPVLRNLDISGAGFDALKLKAINELGAGRNAKLLTQFSSRLWNNVGPWGLSNGSSYTDLGYQNAWDTTRGQSGATGIIVNYTGGNTAGAFTPLSPYSTADQNSQIATYARSFLKKFDTVFPGAAKLWNGKATLSTPFRNSQFLCSYSYFRVGQYTSFAGYEGVPQGAIHFAGEHCSQDFQGYMEGGAREGARAGLEVYHALTGN
jgi:monoamine oxidase